MKTVAVIFDLFSSSTWRPGWAVTWRFTAALLLIAVKAGGAPGGCWKVKKQWDRMEKS